MKPTRDGQGHGLQVAALPWRSDGGLTEVMLITSRETGRFVIPKGWPMKVLDDPAAAAREAWEEAGVEGVVSPEPLGTYAYDKRLSDGRVLQCVVTVYSLAVTHEHAVWRERDQRTRHWLAPGEAARMVAEDDLSRLIAGFNPG